MRRPAFKGSLLGVLSAILGATARFFASCSARTSSAAFLNVGSKLPCYAPALQTRLLLRDRHSVHTARESLSNRHRRCDARKRLHKAPGFECPRRDAALKLEMSAGGFEHMDVGSERIVICGGELLVSLYEREYRRVGRSVVLAYSRCLVR
jgi:hypothetical protein